ncbi:hypothetical protein CRG98_012154 [Punica granatum]|uniref:Uncharacterized protein n=1 Tax=Punica granatum TaxID=22663 RepID=A0A2I0KGX9_PUNGR|nr:hypothetical protein CRG98_012154 [Punica granatum]
MPAISQCVGERTGLTGIVRAQRRRGVLARRGGTSLVVLVDALSCAKGRVIGHAVLVGVSFALEGGPALEPWLTLSRRKGEDRRWSTREGDFHSPVMWGGWPG